MSDITAQFKAAIEPQEFELERGGPVVKLKKVGLMDLIVQGQIPDSLSGMAAEVASRTTQRQMSVDELERYGAVVDAVFTAACVDPKIGKDVQAADVPFAWKVKVFNWASNSAGVLRPFRGEQAGDVEAIQPG